MEAINDLPITQELIEMIREHAAREAPREACGLLIVFRGRLQYRPATNLSDRLAHFILKPEDWADIEDVGEIVCIVHTHVYESPEPSAADLVLCENTKLPWLIVNHPVGHFKLIKPVGYKAPLIGRPFHHSVLDCYALARDYYASKDVQLPNYAREDNWWLKGKNLFLENFEETGFYRVPIEELQVNDAILMQMHAPVPNHCAVLVEDNKILHHVTNRLSSVDVYGGYWRNVTTHVVRYKDPIK